MCMDNVLIDVDLFPFISKAFNYSNKYILNHINYTIETLDINEHSIFFHY